MIRFGGFGGMKDDDWGWFVGVFVISVDVVYYYVYGWVVYGVW